MYSFDISRKKFTTNCACTTNNAETKKVAESKTSAEYAQQEVHEKAFNYEAVSFSLVMDRDKPWQGA